MIKKVRSLNKTISKLKKTIKETEQKSKTWEEDRLRLDETITLACSNFANEGIKNEMFAESKVRRLGEIIEDLRKKVAELETQVRPNIPIEVLDERRKSAT